MSVMTEKMAKASPDAGAKSTGSGPKKGEQFRCQQCGMALQITADCKCKDPDHVHLQCCGEDMQKV